MTLDEISYILEAYFYSGIVKITSKSLKRKDMLQYARLGFAFVMRNLWIQFKRDPKSNNEYYFFSKQILYQTFDLGEISDRGIRRIEFGKITTIDLPENRDILFIYPVNGSCGDIEVNEITQIQPGEEVFYKSADFADIAFFVKRGNGLDTYHIPTCVTKCEVEAVWDLPELDIPNDIAFEVIKYVFVDMFKVKNFTPKTIDDFDPVLGANPQATDQVP